MFLLLAAALGFGASSWDEWADAWRDDTAKLLLGLGLFALVFVALYGTMLYLLSKVGFFDQAGKAAKSILEAVGLADLFKALGRALAFA